MEKSEAVELIQRQVRAQLRHERREAETGVTDMFAGAEPVPDGAAELTEREVDQVWLDYLDHSGCRKVDTTEFANILEATNLFPGDLQSSLLRLIARKQVVNSGIPPISRTLWVGANMSREVANGTSQVHRGIQA